LTLYDQLDVDFPTSEHKFANRFDNYDENKFYEHFRLSNKNVVKCLHDVTTLQLHKHL